MLRGMKRWAAAMLCLAACGGGADAQQPAPKRGGSLTVGFTMDAKTFDPIVSWAANERHIQLLLFNTLVKFDPNSVATPDLAESWSVENDGLAVVFKLRPGVTFQDGTPFNAQAVRWNIDKRLDPASHSPLREQLAAVIQSVEPVDERTVRFNLKAPSPGLFTLLADRGGWMVSPDAYAKLGPDFGSKPVGTGPYALSQWVRGSRIVLERNPNYFDPKLPYLDRIVFSDVSGAVVGIQRLMAGELDVLMDITPQDAIPLETRPDVQLVSNPFSRWYELSWLVDRPPYDNPKLRTAIAHAIDRERLNDILMRGKGYVSDSPSPSNVWWAAPAVKAPGYDPVKARALLKEGGIPEGFPIELWTPQLPLFRQMNQLIAEQLEAVGLKVNLSPVAGSDFYARMQAGTINLTPSRWAQRPDPDGLFYLLFHKSGGSNTARYSNPKVDGLLEEARHIYDQSRRRDLYAAVQEQLVQDLPLVPLFVSVEYIGLKKNVRGFVWTPDQGGIRLAEVWKG